MSRARDFADLAGSADAGGITGKNLIINGAMQVAQRGTSVSVSATATVYGACDRWKIYNSNGGAFDFKQSTDVPSGQGFSNSLQVDVTTASASPSSSHYSFLSHRFEGQDLQRLKKGTANAERLTLSFWVKSSVTGTMAIEMYDADNTRSCSKTFTVNTADTWEYKTITYPADTTGTFDNDNADSLGLNIWIMAGTNFTSGSVSGTWGTPVTADRASAYNIYSSTSNNLYFTGFQLEVGEAATPFEHRSFGDELARCQRYYEYIQYDIGAVAGSSSGRNTRFPYRLAVDKRSSPTVTISSTSTNRCPVPTASSSNQSSVTLKTTNSNTDNDDYTAAGSFTADAEL
jgi:hypothetical protein